MKFDAFVEEQKAQNEKFDAFVEEHRTTHINIDARFDRMDARFDRMDARFDRIEGDMGTLKGDFARTRTVQDARNIAYDMGLEFVPDPELRRSQGDGGKHPPQGRGTQLQER